MRHVVVMVATSYPRFPGDGVGSFMAPIAKGVAALGHDVHMVLPWHPDITLPAEDAGVRFHFFRYAPTRKLSVFGYASGLRADTALRGAAWAVAPLAMLAGIRKAREVALLYGATVMHGHWVIPGGVIASRAMPSLPLVLSLHGSDVFVAEHNWLARRAARGTFAKAAWTTACSEDLRERAVSLGARVDRLETVPYGVDTSRFAPDPATRHATRAEFGFGHESVVFTAGRLVRKKGFEYLIDAVGRLGDMAGVRLVIAGDGDLRHELIARATPIRDRVVFLGARTQGDVARLCAAADVVAVPSVHDDAGNVDGLPNFALEALASATAVVATRVGGLPQAITDGVTGRLVPERNAEALANTIRDLLRHPETARQLGAAARSDVAKRFGWHQVADRLQAAYDRATA